ncbi:hypothetical protein [Neobacillus terrae]|uniref:hypothetical protein n=1 Tax=Neobacillus terrae TaxID=3034837 RepID=UPI0014086C66|nr:hypothetical protein [Neobacillus terrae]NHM29399.1 hypothetical protein [Neobacillus terrae]
MFEQMYIAEMLQKQREIEMKNNVNFYLEEPIIRKPAICRLQMHLPKFRCEKG